MGIALTLGTLKRVLGSQEVPRTALQGLLRQEKELLGEDIHVEEWVPD